MRRTLVPLILSACAAACGPGHPTTPAPAGVSGATTSLPPEPSLQAELTVNGTGGGAFSCSRGGIFLQASVRNLSSQARRLERLEVRFRPTLGSCRPMEAAIDPSLALDLEGGRSAVLRRFDAAGQLCEAPGGGVACGWLATARVVTAADTIAEGVVGFTTHDAPASCDGVLSAVISPRAGAVLSGQIDVIGGVVEGAGCVTSARAIVEGYSEGGERVFTTAPQDLGDRYRWDTTRVANGLYRLTAYQNCCGIRSVPVEVSVRN